MIFYYLAYVIGGFIVCATAFSLYMIKIEKERRKKSLRYIKYHTRRNEIIDVEYEIIECDLNGLEVYMKES